MARIPSVTENSAVSSMFPSTPLVQAISASNGTTTLTVANVSDSFRFAIGMVVTGTGISGSPSLVTAVNNGTGVITIAGGTQSGMTAGNYTFTPSFYLALFTADPTTVGTSGEVTGGSYARQVITFGVPASGVVTSTDAQNFVSMPVEAGGCPYFAVFGTLTGTTAYIGGGTTSGLSGAISAGSTVAVAIGGVTWTQS